MSCPIVGAPHEGEDEPDDVSQRIPLIPFPGKKEEKAKFDIQKQAQQVADWAPRPEYVATRKFYLNVSRTVWVRCEHCKNVPTGGYDYGAAEEYLEDVGEIEWRMGNLLDPPGTDPGPGVRPGIGSSSSGMTGSGPRSRQPNIGAPSGPFVPQGHLQNLNSRALLDGMGMLETLYAGQLARFARTFSLIQSPILEGFSRPLLETSRDTMESVVDGLEEAVATDSNWLRNMAIAAGAVSFTAALGYGAARGGRGGGGLLKNVSQQFRGQNRTPRFDPVTGGNEESDPAVQPESTREQANNSRTVNRRTVRRSFRRTVRSVVERNSRGRLQRRTTRRGSVSVSRV